MVLALIFCTLGNCNATLSGLFNQWNAFSAKINWIFIQSRSIKAPLWILWVLLHSNHHYIFVSYILSGYTHHGEPSHTDGSCNIRHRQQNCSDWAQPKIYPDLAFKLFFLSQRLAFPNMS